jgi:hypothetical protein
MCDPTVLTTVQAIVGDICVAAVAIALFWRLF